MPEFITLPDSLPWQDHTVFDLLLMTVADHNSKLWSPRTGRWISSWL